MNYSNWDFLKIKRLKLNNKKLKLNDHGPE